MFRCWYKLQLQKSLTIEHTKNEKMQDDFCPIAFTMRFWFAKFYLLFHFRFDFIVLSSFRLVSFLFLLLLFWVYKSNKLQPEGKLKTNGDWEKNQNKRNGNKQYKNSNEYWNKINKIYQTRDICNILRSCAETKICYMLWNCFSEIDFPKFVLSILVNEIGHTYTHTHTSARRNSGFTTKNA